MPVNGAPLQKDRYYKRQLPDEPQKRRMRGIGGSRSRAACSTDPGQQGKPPVSKAVVAGTVRALDSMVVLLSAAVAYGIYLSARDASAGQYVAVAGMAILLQANLFHVSKLYTFNEFSNLSYQIARLTAGWLAVFFLLLAIAFLTKTSDHYSRGWVLIWFTSGLGTLLASRIWLFLQLRRWTLTGRLTRNVAIIGAGEHGRRLLQRLNKEAQREMRVVGVFDDRLARRGRVPEVLEGCGVCGSVDDLVQFARDHHVDEIVVALPWSAESRLLDIMRKLRALPVDVKLSMDLIGDSLPRVSVGMLGAVPVVNFLEKPLSDWKLLAKAIEDRVLGALILLFLAPLMLVIALLIKLDSRGPVFFRQKRFGLNNQEIEVWKFRTMRPESASDATVPQAARNDPRVTLIGSLLRRSSLDELPQIFNVLRGDMSLVGPRPHAVPHNQQFATIVDEYAARHRVKPGITGWAQINGWRGETDTVEKIRKRVEHDIHYIDNWSIRFDLRILFMTPLVVLRGENAY